QKCDSAQYAKYLVGMAAVRMGPFEAAERRSECRELLLECFGDGALRRRKSEIGCRCDPQAGEIDPWRIAIGRALGRSAGVKDRRQWIPRVAIQHAGKHQARVRYVSCHRSKLRDLQ